MLKDQVLCIICEFMQNERGIVSEKGVALVFGGLFKIWHMRGEGLLLTLMANVVVL